jgi:hypothetical protein
VTTDTLNGHTRPRIDSGWAVQSIRSCDDWSSGSTECQGCGETVALNRPHVGVQLVRLDGPGSRKKGLESLRRAFCSEDCFQGWLDRRRE